MRPHYLLRAVPFVFPVLCTADPDAQPEAIPDPAAIAEAEPQTYTNNAPFSGAIYIVNPDGQAVTAQSSNMCPDYASLSCGDISQPSWCCPSGYTCASPANANGMVGCCPSGNACGGSVNVASVSTVTVYGVQQTTQAYVHPPPATETVGVYNQPDPAAAGYCQTLTMSGPNLPRVTQGECGTILIVNEGAQSVKTLGYGLGAVLVILHAAVGRMFHRI